MKKIIKFSSAFLPMVVISSLLIITGLVGLATKGINLGIDFQAGFIEKVRIAPTAMNLSYRGTQSVVVNVDPVGLEVVSTGVGSDNQSWLFSFAEYPTLSDMVAALTTVPGVAVAVTAPAETPSSALFASSDSLNRLSEMPYRLHYVPSGAQPLSTDDVRAVLGSYAGASVQVLGDPADRMFQIRLRDDGTDPDANNTLRAGVKAALVQAFGEEGVAVISTDFVGSRFSQSLAKQAVWLVLATLGLIMVYASIRFRWDFALGAVLAITHDALIMIAFVVWTQMEFNSITIAAIMTIIGYSINDTIVVFDRIRENMRLNPGMNITDLLNLSQTETLGRSIITTVTTMLAVLALFIFTTGDMKNFALALLVGMTSGVYSTIIIASAFISFVSRFRKDKGITVEKVKPVLSGEVV